MRGEQRWEIHDFVKEMAGEYRYRKVDLRVQW